MCNFGEYQTADMFQHIGHKRDGYELIDHFEASGRETFAEVEEPKATKADILNLISKDKLVSPENIAKVLKVKREWVARNIAELIQAGALVQNVQVIDGVEQIERQRTPAAQEILKKLPPPKTTEILLRYSYQKRPEAPGKAIIDTTRPFCKKVMSLSEEGRVYTRAEIEQISARLGYSVFERGGGFWFHDGKADIQCRHYWRTEILLKKSKDLKFNDEQERDENGRWASGGGGGSNSNNTDSNKGSSESKPEVKEGYKPEKGFGVPIDDIPEVGKGYAVTNDRISDDEKKSAFPPLIENPFIGSKIAEYKIEGNISNKDLANHIIEKGNELGLNVSTTVQTSTTDYGESHYINISKVDKDGNIESKKFRVSDHNVTNKSRLENEFHTTKSNIGRMLAEADMWQNPNKYEKVYEKRVFREKIFDQPEKDFKPSRDIIKKTSVSKKGNKLYSGERLKTAVIVKYKPKQ